MRCTPALTIIPCRPESAILLLGRVGTFKLTTRDFVPHSGVPTEASTSSMASSIVKPSSSALIAEGSLPH